MSYSRSRVRSSVMPKPSPFASVKLDINAGTDRSPVKPASEAPLRILLFGDFSGRANRGAPAPPSRKPVMIDRDNFDQVMAHMGAELHLGGGQQGPRMALRFQELEDFHPDRIYEKIELFQTLRDRKSTRLNSSHLGISYAVFCLKKE